MASESFLISPITNSEFNKAFLNTLKPDDINKLIDIQGLSSLKPENTRTRGYSYAIKRAREILKNKKSVKNFLNSTKNIPIRSRISTQKTPRTIVDKKPWRVVDTTNGTNITKLEFIDLVGQYLLEWVDDPRKMMARKTTNGTKRKYNVGKMCNNPDTNPNWCGKPSVHNRYTVESNNNRKLIQYIKKNGAAGMGVPQISREIFKKWSSEMSTVRRQLLGHKRTGDLSMSMLVTIVNKYDNYSVTDGETKYKNLVFWSGDRPACMMAFLLGAPMYKSLKGDLRFIDSWRRGSKNMRNTNNEILSKLLKNWREWNGDISPDKLGTQLWFKYMCIIDTAHDFGKSRSTYEATYAQREIIMNLFKNIYGVEENDIVTIFKTIKTIEPEMNNFLNQYGKNVTTTTVYLDDNTGIVYDQGSPSPRSKGVGNRMVYSVAKLMDPAM